MSALTVCLSLFVLVWIQETDGQCMDTWTVYQESCYKIIPNKESWLDANQYCKLFGAYLAELTTRDEMNFAKMEYAERHLDNGTWIGLSDILIEGVWMWTSDKSVAVETDWAPSEPGNRTEEDCVMIYTDNLWHDHWCNVLHYYMCEMSLNTDPVIG